MGHSPDLTGEAVGRGSHTVGRAVLLCRLAPSGRGQERQTGRGANTVAGAVLVCCRPHQA